MAKPLIQVEGARELRRQMKKAGVDMGNLASENQAAGRVVTDAAQARVPKRSGALAASLRPAKAVGGVTVRAGGARAPYAAPIHWGWPSRNIAPSLFLTDAAAETEARWVDIYWQALNKALNQVKGER